MSPPAFQFGALPTPRIEKHLQYNHQQYLNNSPAEGFAPFHLKGSELSRQRVGIIVYVTVTIPAAYEGTPSTHSTARMIRWWCFMETTMSINGRSHHRGHDESPQRLEPACGRMAYYFSGHCWDRQRRLSIRLASWKGSPSKATAKMVKWDTITVSCWPTSKDPPDLLRKGCYQFEVQQLPKSQLLLKQLGSTGIPNGAFGKGVGG